MLYDVPQDQLIEKTADELKKLVHMPSWAPFVKTGHHKDRPPADPEWWYTRSAAVLRKIYLKGPIGVSKLRIHYGGKKNRGMKPEKFVRGSGSVLRKVLQGLEEAKLIKQASVGKHKGRIITPKGTSLLFSAAKGLGGSLKKQAPKAPAVKKEAPVAVKPEAKVPEVKKETPVAKKEEAKVPAKAAKPKKDHVVPKEEQLMKAPKAAPKKAAKKKEAKK